MILRLVHLLSLGRTAHQLDRAEPKNRRNLRISQHRAHACLTGMGSDQFLSSVISCFFPTSSNSSNVAQKERTIESDVAELGPALGQHTLQ